jgi:NADP-dependent aldehyde dehydrogenase
MTISLEEPLVTTAHKRQIAGTDPRTGEPLSSTADETDTSALDEVVAVAAAAAVGLVALGRLGRARLLRRLAEAVEAHRADLVAIADTETGLGTARLDGELTRTVFQLSFFAEVLDEGSYLEATIDPAADTPMGPRPDLRRMLVPGGPVAVFGASNFPFAFSVPGGDTVSALAAGCPVVVKAHGSHPATSLLAYQVLRDAARESGAPEGAIGIVFGRKAGEALVSHPAICAVGFTGSLSGGRALLAAIGRRPEPIPFYGELSSLNPLVVTAAAAAEKAEEIGAGVVASVTGSAGQLCTKPGLILIPVGAEGDKVVAAAVSAMADVQAGPLLNDRIHASYQQDTDLLRSAAGVSVLAHGMAGDESGFRVRALLVGVDASQVSAPVFEEYFGPAAVVVRYRSIEELTAVLGQLPASLTATVHLGSGERPDELLTTLGSLAGRIVFDGFPTGVSVSWAQHHGGPWPASNSVHTSVGATAIRRFLRPLTWQNAPGAVLPAELHDGATSIPRRVNGVLQLPSRSD